MKKVEVLTLSNNEYGCMVANGILICRCGKCKIEMYKQNKPKPS